MVHSHSTESLLFVVLCLESLTITCVCGITARSTSGLIIFGGEMDEAIVAY